MEACRWTPRVMDLGLTICRWVLWILDILHTNCAEFLTSKIVCFYQRFLVPERVFKVRLLIFEPILEQSGAWTCQTHWRAAPAVTAEAGDH